jgi:hypothetical protein
MFRLLLMTYPNLEERTSGSQNAAATFALAAGNTNPQGIADPRTADMLLLPAAVSSPSNGQTMSVPSSTSIPSSGSPLSTVDQILADLDLLLSAAQNGYQSETSSVAVQWQSADALALQRLDALLNLEAGAMGITKGTPMRDFLFASMSSPNG